MVRFELVTAWSLKLWYYIKEPSQLKNLNFYMIDIIPYPKSLLWQIGKFYVICTVFDNDTMSI